MCQVNLYQYIYYRLPYPYIFRTRVIFFELESGGGLTIKWLQDERRGVHFDKMAAALQGALIMNQDHILHFYGELREGQWTVMCLNFSLAVQAESLSEAKLKINQQVDMYLKDAIEGQDRAHARELLNRSAPAKYWLKYYWHRATKALFNVRDGHITENHHRSFAVA